jgi:hypothetical protein
LPGNAGSVGDVLGRSVVGCVLPGAPAVGLPSTPETGLDRRPSPVRATTPGTGSPGVVARSEVNARFAGTGKLGGSMHRRDRSYAGVDPSPAMAVLLGQPGPAAVLADHRVADVAGQLRVAVVGQGPVDHGLIEAGAGRGLRELHDRQTLAVEDLEGPGPAEHVAGQLPHLVAAADGPDLVLNLDDRDRPVLGAERQGGRGPEPDADAATAEIEKVRAWAAGLHALLARYGSQA